MLIDQIKSDLIVAMKSKDELKMLVLRSLLSAVNYYKIENQKEETDADIQSVLAKEAKKHRESIEMYEKGGRTELVENEKKELDVLQAYMPKQMGEDEVEKIIKAEVDKLKASGVVLNQGMIMKSVMPIFKGKADGRVVSEIVRKFIS